MRIEFLRTGTKWIIDLHEANCDYSRLSQAIDKISRNFEHKYSRFKGESFTRKISNTIGEFQVPYDSKLMLDLYFDLYKYTDGVFTPLIGSALIEAGYDENYSFKGTISNKIPKLDSVARYEFPTIVVKEPVVFDFGGIGKGLLIDQIANLIKENGLNNFTINAGGDILNCKTDNTPISVGLENPEDKNSVVGKVVLVNKSICASSGNRRTWGKYHHILDPSTLESPTEIIATWAISDTAILADAISTCLFLISPEHLKRYYEYEYLVLYKDYTYSKSENFPAEMYI